MRTYHGHKVEIKNIGLVVKNTVNSYLSNYLLAKHGSLTKYLASFPDPSHTASIAYKSIMNSFEVKLRTKLYDSADIWTNLAELGVNPVDVLFPNTSCKYLWHIGGIPLVPVMFSQTDGSPSRPSFDAVQAASNGERCDSLVRKVLSLPTIFISSETAAPLRDPRSRLFALFLTVPNPFAICAYSTELERCFEAWIDELGEMDDDYRMRAISQVFRSLDALSGSMHLAHACPQDFLRPCSEFVEKVFSKVSEVNLPPDMVDPYDDTKTNARGSLFTYLGIQNEDRVRFCSRVAGTGNHALTVSVMDSLVRAPRLYIEACKTIGLTGDQALDYLSENLSRAAWYRPQAYSNILNITKLTDAFRDEFIAAGYPDPVGTKAFDFIAQNLYAGEHFEALGYIRREDHGRPGLFAKLVGEDFSGSGDISLIKRKVELAVKLDQRDLLRNEIECYFKKSRSQSRNVDIGKVEAIKHIIDSRYFDPEEILHNGLRREKALEMGVRGRDILSNNSESRKLKIVALEYDLGL